MTATFAPFLLAPCGKPGCSISRAVAVRRSRPALASESAGALTGAAPALTEAVVKIPGGLSPDGAVRVVRDHTSLRGPARPYAGEFVSPLRIPAERLSVLPLTTGRSAGVRSTPRRSKG